jgi:hypothetical protein
VMNAQATLDDTRIFHACQARIHRRIAAEHERNASKISSVLGTLRDAIAQSERRPRSAA